MLIVYISGYTLTFFIQYINNSSFTTINIFFFSFSQF